MACSSSQPPRPPTHSPNSLLTFPSIFCRSCFAVPGPSRACDREAHRQDGVSLQASSHICVNREAATTLVHFTFLALSHSRPLSARRKTGVVAQRRAWQQPVRSTLINASQFFFQPTKLHTDPTYISYPTVNHYRGRMREDRPSFRPQDSTLAVAPHCHTKRHVDCDSKIT